MSPQYSQETPHSSSVRARYVVSFVNLNADLCSALVSVYITIYDITIYRTALKLHPNIFPSACILIVPDILAGVTRGIVKIA